ncbi:hypothetical protein [Streptomyces lydicus]
MRQADPVPPLVRELAVRERRAQRALDSSAAAVSVTMGLTGLSS